MTFKLSTVAALLFACSSLQIAPAVDAAAATAAATAAADVRESSMKFPTDSLKISLEAMFEAKMPKQNDNDKGLHNRRSLAQRLFPNVPPTYQCGDVIARASKDDIIYALSFVVNTLFADGTPTAPFRAVALQALTSPIEFGLEARVSCASCEEVQDLYSGEAFLEDDSLNGWLSYCGADKFGANVTQSSLLVLPINETTGLPVEGRLKSFFYNQGTALQQQDVTSQRFPTDLGMNFDEFNATDVVGIVGDIFAKNTVWPAIMAAGSGAVVIEPDYIGKCSKHYGQAGLHWIQLNRSKTAHTVVELAEMTTGLRTLCIQS